MQKYITCPVCGFITITEEYDICKICFWEYEDWTLKYPEDYSGANNNSLVNAQTNYSKFGASSLEIKKYTRLPSKDDIFDSKWEKYDKNKHGQWSDENCEQLYWLRKK